METRRVVSLLVLLMVLPAVGFAAVTGLPKTGQTTSYASLDDGDVEAGVAWPLPRFTDNGDGTMTDTLTGLMWLKNMNPTFLLGVGACILNGAMCSGAVTWQEALDFVKGINDGTHDLSGVSGYSGGYHDWRLPTIQELWSLSNAEEAGLLPWMESQGFVVPSATWVPPKTYWSSTSAEDSAYGPSNAWFFDTGVDVYNGMVNLTGKINRTCLAWPVRAGTTGDADLTFPANVPKTGQHTCYDTTGAQRPCAGTGEDGELRYGVSSPDPRFTDNGDGTVTDLLTGLMWLRHATCLGYDTWAAGFGKVGTLNDSPGTLSCSGYTAAYTDWRVPNIRELASLIDRSQPFTSPDSVLPEGHPFLEAVSDSKFYMSSSSNAATPSLRNWSLGLRFGNIIHASKTEKQYIWPVRGASSSPLPPLRGDLNDDGTTDLADAVIALQVECGIYNGVSVTTDGDVDHDGKIGLAEAVYAVKAAAGQ